MSSASFFLRGTGAVTAASAGYYFLWKDNNPSTNDSPFSITPPRETLRYQECNKLLKQNSHKPVSREEIIKRMKEHSKKENPCDFFVVGGGAVGSGAALEAQARGMKVVLAEQEDFASGASSKSTKLIHGGVRYLEKAFLGADFAQLKLVYEALRERAVLISQAPHLCHELPTMVPCFTKFDLGWFWAGMKAYDFLAVLGGSNLPTSRIVWPDEVRRWFPSLKHSLYKDPYNNNKVASDSHVIEQSDKKLQQEAIQKETNPLAATQRLQGAVVYYDGQMDDARLNVSIALTANALGAACANYCSVTGFIFDDEKKRVIGAQVKDSISGESFPVYSRAFLNATGAFSDKIRNILLRDLHEAKNIGNSNQEQQHQKEMLNVIIPATGAHVTLPQAVTLSSASHGGGCSPALLIPKTQDGRVLFVTPWNGKTIAGTTDNKTDKISNYPEISQKDVDFIIQQMKPYFNFPVDQSDVSSTWCGIRPLAVSPDQLAAQAAAGKKETNSSSQNVVREHVVFGEGEVAGFASIAGGKWTTYNKMSCDAVAQTIELSGDEKLKQEIRDQPVSRYLKLVGAQQVPLNLELVCAEALEKTEKKLLMQQEKDQGKENNSSGIESETGRFCKDEVARHLATSYGDRSFLILDMIYQQQKQKTSSSASSSSSSWFGGSSSSSSNKNKLLGLDILYPSLPILSVEVSYACKYEMCETPVDFLARRSRAAFLDAEGILRKKDYVKKVAEIMGQEKGWDAKRIEKETNEAIEKLKKGFQVSK